MSDLSVVDYPGLDLRHFAFKMPKPLGEVPSPDWLTEMLDVDADVPVRAPKWARSTVRDLFRHYGYRPTGRGKPSSEYLAGAAGRDALVSINAVVDCGNVASLHSGLPISVIDRGRANGMLHVDVPGPGSSYVFNRSGQVIEVSGLLSLFDGDGPCANAVKDAQRTKTDDATQRLLIVVWSPKCPEPDYPDRVLAWLVEMATRLGAEIE